MAGIDGFTKLMLHCNGVDASTVFTDDSASAHTVVPNGSAKIDTADFKFGGASGEFDGTGGSTTRLTIADSPDWDFGNGDFTIDLWYKPTTQTSHRAIISQWGATNRSFYFAAENGLLRLIYSQAGTTDVIVMSTATLDLNVWQHIAVVRDGTNIRFFKNGVASGVVSIGTDTFDPSTRPLNVSTYADGTGQEIEGWVDEIRISKGIARWTAAFTPPTSEYTTNLTLVDINTDVRVSLNLSLTDINTDIRIVNDSISDIDTDIRVAFTTSLNDVDTDIRAVGQSLDDINTDIRTVFAPNFGDIDTDIRTHKLELEDLNTDIRARLDVDTEVDINTDIRVKGDTLVDLDFDIRVVSGGLSDYNTDIRVALTTYETNVEVESITIREGYYLSNLNVNLDLEVGGALQMQFRNESDLAFTALEPYTDTKVWVLSAGNGIKKVYARFIDISGNVTTGNTFTEAVIFIGTPPEAILEIFTDETATTPIVDSTYQNDNGPFFRWLVPSSVISIAGFTLQFDDELDNVISLEAPDVIVNGLEITKRTPLPEMTLDMSSGAFYYAGDLKNINVQDLVITDGGVLDRVDLLYMDGGTTSLNVLEGIESATPVAPDLPEEGIAIASVYVPAGTTNVAGLTITDLREFYVNVNNYLSYNLESGQYVFRLKTIYENGDESAENIYNLWIANSSPEIGELDVYNDSGKTIQFSNGIFQTADDTPFVEWTPAPAEPGPINYYYTVDGSEPTVASPFTVGTTLNLGPFGDGTTQIKVRPYDTVSGNFGQVKSFSFVYGSTTYANKTIVVGDNSILSQEDGQIQVKDISWDFDSARLCRIYHPVEFDANLPFELDENITVVYNGQTVFNGSVKRIERTIDIGAEGVIYNCIGPRGILNECYGYIDDPEFGETAQITFNDVAIEDAITTITSKAPAAIKSIENFPTGANITDEYVGQTMSNIIQGLYSRTKYGWYITPQGVLRSIDATAINPGQAKFGVYGTTVSSLAPQYNVMASNLQFDVTNRYNKAVVEGARKKELVTLTASCGVAPISTEEVNSSITKSTDSAYKIFQLNTKWPVVKVIKTYVTYARIKQMTVVPYGAFGDQTTWTIVLREWSVCRDNNIINRGTKPVLSTGFIDTDIRQKGAEVSDDFASKIEASRTTIGYAPAEMTTATEVQGSLGPNNTIRYSRGMYSYWPTGISFGTGPSFTVRANATIKNMWGGAFGGVLNYSWRNPPKKRCATVRADVLIETTPLRTEVSLPGTALKAKTLRIVKTDFKYSEDPDNPVDDTARMVEYATDALNKTTDIKVEGSIILDTIDLSWDLDKTVNLINTQQASWTSLNAKVTGIKYNFDENTTTLEITSEFLK